MKKSSLFALFLVFVFLAACSKTPVENKASPAVYEKPSGQQQSQAEAQEGIYKVTTLEYPKSADLGQKFIIKWKVESSENKSIEHTAVHYSNNSAPDAKVPSDYRFVSKIQAGKIPGEFSSEFAVETYGTMYFRTHAIIDGKHYWSEEKSFVVKKPKEQETTPQVKQLTIEADDNGFYPGDAIKVNKGEKVYIEFVARKDNVYYGGLQIKSKYFDTGKIIKGEKATVDFSAFESFTITSYWPSSGVKKADLEVVVG